REPGIRLGRFGRVARCVAQLALQLRRELHGFESNVGRQPLHERLLDAETALTSPRLQETQGVGVISPRGAQQVAHVALGQLAIADERRGLRRDVRRIGTQPMLGGGQRVCEAHRQFSCSRVVRVAHGTINECELRVAVGRGNERDAIGEGIERDRIHMVGIAVERAGEKRPGNRIPGGNGQSWVAQRVIDQPKRAAETESLALEVSQRQNALRIGIGVHHRRRMLDQPLCVRATHVQLSGDLRTNGDALTAPSGEDQRAECDQAACAIAVERRNHCTCEYPRRNVELPRAEGSRLWSRSGGETNYRDGRHATGGTRPVLHYYRVTDEQVRYLTVDPDRPDADIVRRAGELLRRGGLVAFPTETVYGLGANALDANAVARIFAAKGRPTYDPLIVHVLNAGVARAVAREWPDAAERLARAFWPGPLTLVVPKRRMIPDIVTAGLDTVGLRVPSHPVARAILEAATVPIAAPSANRFSE